LFEEFKRSIPEEVDNGKKRVNVLFSEEKQERNLQAQEEEAWDSAGSFSGESRRTRTYNGIKRNSAR